VAGPERSPERDAAGERGGGRHHACPGRGHGAVRRGRASGRHHDEAAAVSLDSAIADLAARVASAPVVDVEAPSDSVVVRIGSQTLQTVLFVNGQQLGIVGGRGLIEATVPQGLVSRSVRRINCRDWDTTFTGLAGRRYTFVERSPTC
jgi:hypothetical protein